MLKTSFHHKFKRARWAIWQLCNAEVHWSQALFGAVSVWMGDQNNIPLIKKKHRTENTINANKCELSKVQILLAYFMQKQILMQK